MNTRGEIKMRGHRWTKEENRIVEENLYRRDSYIKKKFFSDNAGITISAISNKKSRIKIVKREMVRIQKNSNNQ